MPKNSHKLAAPAAEKPGFSLFDLCSWKTAFWTITLAAAVGIPILSLGYGIIWDEWIQSQYGKLVLKFLLSWGHDQSALKFGETMYLYGGLFDTITAAIYGTLFDSVKNVANYSLQTDFIAPHWHDTRHVVNALFGFTAILFTGLTSRKISGWRAGTFTLVFLILSPRFFGNSMNNPKDIPFATAAAIFTYFMICLIEEIPAPTWKTLAGTALGIAMALNIKAGGLLFFCYLGLFTGLIWLQAKKQKSNAFSLMRLIQILLPISLCGYLGGLIFWPFGLLNPLTHPLQALGAFSQFGGAQGQLLFEGLIYKHGETPWYYLPKWILISSPLFFIFSLFLFAGIAKNLFSKYSKTILSFLIFCALFPLGYAILRKSVVYDSWRHFLFIYPAMIILAALAWNTLFDLAQTVFKKSAVAFFLILFLWEPLGWMIQNHPNEYVYFNPLVGGLRGAYGRYETDYWGNCLRRASEALVNHARSQNQAAPLIIRSDGEPISAVPFLVKGLGRRYIPFIQGKNEWQYSLEFSRSRDPHLLLNNQWPGPQAVYTVNADQAPLCAVIEKSAETKN